MNKILRIVIILFLGLFCSNEMTANTLYEKTSYKSVYNISNSFENGRYRFVGSCSLPGGWTIYIYKDEYYYYYSFCDTSYDLTKDGCRPERLYKDSVGWYALDRYGDKEYLYVYIRGDKHVVRDIERDVYKY